MPFGAFNFSRSAQDSTSSSQSRSGLGLEEYGSASRHALDTLFGGYGGPGARSTFEDILRAPTPTFQYAPAIPAGGLFPEQQAGIDQFGRDLFSRFSGQSAQRGFLNPANTAAVAGSAMTAAAPSLLSLIQRNRELARQQELERLNSLFMPQQFKMNATQPFLNFAGLLPGFLGSTSTSQAWSSGGSTGGGLSGGTGGGKP